MIVFAFQIVVSLIQPEELHGKRIILFVISVKCILFLCTEYSVKIEKRIELWKAPPKRLPDSATNDCFRSIKGAKEIISRLKIELRY